MTALRDSYPLYLANEAQTPNLDLEVTDKYTGKVATRVALANAAIIDAGIAATVEAAEPMARMPAYARQEVLAHCVKRFQERFEELAYALCIEAGKPIRDARGEVTRLIDTFRIAAEESVRMTGEVQPLDISPRAKGFRIDSAASLPKVLRGCLDTPGVNLIDCPVDYSDNDPILNKQIKELSAAL